MSDANRRSFRRLPLSQRVALALGLCTGLWAVFIALIGGIDLSVLGLRIRSNRWSDPAIVAVLSLLVFAGLRRASSLFGWFRTPSNLLLLAILGVAALVRFWALAFGLPHPAARPDEEAIAAMAGLYYLGTFTPDDFTYPPLFMLIVAATIWFVFHKLPPTLSRLNVHLPLSDPSTAAWRLAGRFWSAAAGLISVFFVHRIGTKLFGPSTGLTSAACLALAFLHVRDSHFGVTDIPMTCMVLVAFFAIVKLSQSGSRRDLVTAGILTGLAVATKYNAALLVLPASFAVLNDPIRRPVVRRLGAVVGFAAIMTAAFFLVCPSAVFKYQKFLFDLTNVSQHLSGGHGADLGRGWIYHLTTTLRYGLGLPLLAAGLLGLGLMLWREGRRGVLVALFPVAYYLVTGSGRTVFARYILPVVPFLCLTAGYFIATTAAMLSARLHRPGWRVPATALMTAAVLWPSIVSVVTFDRLIARDDSRLLARRWIEARYPPGTTIAQIGMGIASSALVYINYEEIGYVRSEIPPGARPTLVVVVSSPLGSPPLDGVRPWLEREYDLQYDKKGVGDDDPANIYDRQDEFYLPLAGFHGIERPGPNVKIYVRR